MFGKRFFHDQSGLPAIPQVAAGAASVHPPQPELPVKYEYDSFSMHQQPVTNNLDGAVGGASMMPKHQAQPNSMSHQPNELKYSCSIDFARQNGARVIDDLVGHNHTYTLPQGTGATPKPQARDKKAHKKPEDEHLSRDEKRARALNVSLDISDTLCICERFHSSLDCLRFAGSNVSGGYCQLADGRIQ